MIQNKISRLLNYLGFSFKDLRVRPSIKFMKERNRRKLKCIEIGTLYGDNALNMLKNLDIAEIFCIDPYLDYSDYKEDFAHNVVEKAEFIAKDKLRKYSLKVKFVKEFSDKAAKKFKNGQFDFIYVDGNHSYKYVKKDLELYYPKLKNNGVLAGDDIGWEGVSRAVCEFIAKHKEVKLIIDEPDWIIINPAFLK